MINSQLKNSSVFKMNEPKQNMYMQLETTISDFVVISMQFIGTGSAMHWLYYDAVLQF